MYSLIADFIAKIKQGRSRITVIGDSMVDEPQFVQVNRLSTEGPVPVLLVNPSRLPVIPSVGRMKTPGGAANVVHQFKHFNVEGHLASFRDTTTERILWDNLGMRACDTCVQIPGRLPRKQRFYDEESGQFLFRLDIESPNCDLNPEELQLARKRLLDMLLDGKLRLGVPTDVIIFSDYGKGMFVDDYFSRIIQETDIPTIVDPKDGELDKWYGCTIFKPNAEEAQRLSGETDWQQQCDYFISTLHCQAVVITQGGHGVVGYDQLYGEYFEYSGSPIEHPNVVGAGDCFVAFLALAISHGFEPRKAAEIAYEAGAVYVSHEYKSPIWPVELAKRADPIGGKIVEVGDIPTTKGLVFSNGIFDVATHVGHLAMLEFAKKQGEKLVVAVNSDASTSRLKPGRPIVKEQDRLRMLASLSCVDYVVLFDEDTPLELIKAIRPAVLVKGSEYAPHEIVGAEWAEKVVTFPMVPGCSTTKLVEQL